MLTIWRWLASALELHLIGHSALTQRSDDIVPCEARNSALVWGHTGDTHASVPTKVSAFIANKPLHVGGDGRLVIQIISGHFCSFVPQSIDENARCNDKQVNFKGGFVI
jgi:hypothetical protein